MTYKEPLHIKDIVGSALKTLNLQEKKEQQKVLAFWEKAVGEKIIKHATPHSLTPQGKLLVYVDSSAWVEELSRFHKNKIKKRLNVLSKQDLIKEIFFRVGERPIP